MTCGAVDRERIPAGRRNYKWTPSLPEKAGGFTKRSYPEGHMVCGVYTGEGRGCAARLPY